MKFKVSCTFSIHKHPEFLFPCLHNGCIHFLKGSNFRWKVSNVKLHPLRVKHQHFLSPTRHPIEASDWNAQWRRDDFIASIVDIYHMECPTATFHMLLTEYETNNTFSAGGIAHIKINFPGINDMSSCSKIISR